MLLYGIELAAGTSAQNLVVEGSATLPDINLFGGRLYFKSDTKTLELYDGTQWVTVLSGTQSTYQLPIATDVVLGGIKIGSGLTINPSTGVLASSGVTAFNTRSGNVTLSTADVQAVLPVASSTVLGAIKVGSGLSISSGILSATGSGSGLPDGVIMLFLNPTAPVGWTQLNGDITNNRMLRVVNGLGGGSGGSHTPILMDVVPTHVHTITGTVGQGGQHSHSLTLLGDRSSGAIGNKVFGDESNYPSSVLTTDTAPNHTHSFVGSASNNTGASNWTPRYLDLIACTKNAGGVTPPPGPGTSGYQVINLSGTVIGATSTDLPTDAGTTAGYVIINVGSNKTLASPTGLTNASEPNYTAKIQTNGINVRYYENHGLGTQTYSDLINRLNSEFGSYTASLVGGNIKIVSPIVGVPSVVEIGLGRRTPPNVELFPSLSGFVGITSTPGNGSNALAATIVVNSISYSISLAGTSAQNYTDLLAEINLDLAGAAIATLVDGDIVVTSATTGIDSSVSISDISLFSSLPNFLSISAPVPGG